MNSYLRISDEALVVVSMNILLINHYAGSPKHGMEYRPYELAREWARSGHNVTIVASSFSHLRNRNPEVSEKITSEIIDDINFLWIKSIEYERNDLYRVLNMIQFAWDLFRFSKQISSFYKPNLVIASSPHPFIIYGARKIAQQSNAKLVFEVRDLWPLTLIELGSIPSWHPFIWLMQRTENFAYEKSSWVVSLLPKAEQYMKEHGMKGEKFIYVPNGINIEHWRKQSRDIPLEHYEKLSALKKEGRFIVGYVGTHGLANALDYLLEAASILKQYPISFVLVGEGPEKTRLQQLVERKKLINVFFLSPVSRDCIPQLLDMIDVLYIGWKKEKLYRYGVSPNKLMDYMMAAKPVVHAIEAGNDPVRESGCGISIPPESPDHIAEAILEIYQLPEKKRKEMGENGRQFIIKYHDYRVLAQNFLEEIYKEGF